MNNKVQPGRVLNLALPIAAVGGDPVAIGKIRGVAVYTGTAGATVTVDTQGVFDLSVKAATAALSTGAGAAISVGQTIWYNSGHTPKLSISTVSATAFGVALEAIAASATDTINVLVVPVDLREG